MHSALNLSKTCQPRDEVLAGQLTDEMFAAQLYEVVSQRAHPLYQDPELFFANTYATERVRSLFREVLGRLSGKDATASSLFRLETTFGGGKTHTLIALYHLVSGGLSPATLLRLDVDPDLVPEDPVQVVALVGDRMDPVNGVPRDGITVRHLWGELAYQLGGVEGYGMVRESDERGLAPGAHFLERLVGNRPTLILIDEAAALMRRMGQQAGQLPAFLKTLLDWVPTARRTVLVITLARAEEEEEDSEGTQATDAFQEETGQIVEAIRRAAGEANSVLSREIRVVTLARREEIPSILRQRLFLRVDQAQAQEVARLYFQGLKTAAGKGALLPHGVTRADYLQKLQAYYPFHPAFIELLDGKLSVIPNFQRTRGALRLLARVIRRLWQIGAEDLLIHPFSVDLSVPEILDEVTSRLDRPRYREVAEYDVANPRGDSHAQELDAKLFAGHPPYARRVATTVFLHSLPEPPARGVRMAELMAATITPDADPALLAKALDGLMDEAWHLDKDGDKYLFRTEPSLNKIVADETDAVQETEARQEVERRIEEIWKDSGLAVVYFPNSPADLPDRPEGRLVIVHWDTARVKPTHATAPDHLQELWGFSGSQREYRRFKNTLFFLVADGDEERRRQVLLKARRLLALDRLVRDPRRLQGYNLSEESRRRLREWHDSAPLELRIAITRLYQHLFYPGDDPGTAKPTLVHYQLNLAQQADAKENLTPRILDTLRELGQVKVADDAPLGTAWVRQHLFGKEEGALTTDEMYRRFAERPRLPLLLTRLYLQKVVRNGLKAGAWLYYDARKDVAYDDDRYLEEEVVIDDHHQVVLPQEAKRRALKVYRPQEREADKETGKEKGKRVSDGRGDYVLEKPRQVARLHAEAEARRALEDLAAQARDAGYQALGALTVRWTGDKADVLPRLASIATILGQLPHDQVHIDVNLSWAYSDAETGLVDLKVSRLQYNAIASHLPSLAQGAQDAHLRVVLNIAFTTPLPLEGPAWDEMGDVMELADLGTVTLEATPPQDEGRG